MRLAILYDKDQIYKPSNPRFIAKLIMLCANRHIHCEILSQTELHKLADFDALFIRDTTQREHYTHYFSMAAEAMQIPVIDDVRSIWRCGSKLIQHELFIKHKIPYPLSRIITRQNFTGLGYPVIVKMPDSSFSRGVYKIDSRAQFNAQIIPLFYKTPRLLAQEYLRTEFDWRIGVLAGQPLFAIKYFILPGDYRIVAPDRECDHETVPSSHTPPDVLALALRAAAVIGNGLYGVDIKDCKGELYVIEVNDNPSIDHGTEDTCEGDAIYHAILDYLFGEQPHG